MAFSNKRVTSTPTALAEINVTPLVDVMLVLLIIFMVCAPMMQQGAQVELPKANAGALTDVPDQIVLIVSKHKEIMMNGTALPHGTLLERLEAIAKAKPGVQVFVQADQAVPYGFIAQIIAEVKKAQINHVGLVTDPADPKFKL